MPDTLLPSLFPSRILAAEDFEINREILRAGLGPLGHFVEFAVNGADALEKLQAKTFDLVLMDVQMPIMDGLETTRRIRMLERPLRDVPIIGLTANVLLSQRQSYIAAGMNECLTKPIEWDRLTQMIDHYACAFRG